MSVRKQPNTDLRPIRWNHADEAAGPRERGNLGSGAPRPGEAGRGFCTGAVSVLVLCCLLIGAGEDTSPRIGATIY